MKHLFLLITAITLINCSCSDKGTNPPGKNGLDTTSHNFSWQTFEFGVYPSILNDVAIINENDIWAVGEIRTEETGRFDSLGNWIDHYNAIHWDGNEWEMKRFEFLTFCNQPDKGIYPAISVYVFDTTKIYITSGSQITSWNGFTQLKIECVPVSINKTWGLSPDNYYIVGSGGSIAHYNGQSWRKLESGTDKRLTDVWGSPDGTVVWVAGFDQVDGSILLRDTGSGFEKVVEINDPASPELHNIISYVFRSIWTDSPDTVYVCSVGRVYNTPVDYTTYALENKWFDYNNEQGLPNETRIIRGNSRNDLFIAGFKNEIRHYNGKSWFRYNELLTESGYWYSMDVKDNVVVAVGETSGSAATITIGNR